MLDRGESQRRLYRAMAHDALAAPYSVASRVAPRSSNSEQPLVNSASGSHGRRTSPAPVRLFRSRTPPARSPPKDSPTRTRVGARFLDRACGDSPFDAGTSNRVPQPRHFPSGPRESRLVGLPRRKPHPSTPSPRRAGNRRVGVGSASSSAVPNAPGGSLRGVTTTAYDMR